MFLYYRKDIFCDLHDKTPVKKFTEEEVDDLILLSDNTMRSISTDNIKPSYDAFHINRFLRFNNSSEQHYHNNNLNFGYLSKFFKRDENITQDDNIPHRRILLDIINKKMNFDFDPVITQFIFDLQKKTLFETYLRFSIDKLYIDLNVFNDAYYNDNPKISDINITGKKNFYIIGINRRAGESKLLSKMSDFNVKNTHKLICDIYNESSNNDINIVIHDRGFFTKKHHKLISYWEKHFDKAHLAGILTDLNQFSNFVIFSGKKRMTVKNEQFENISIDVEIRNRICATWKKIIEIKLKLIFEVKIMEYIWNQNNLFNAIYDIFQIACLKENMAELETHSISHNTYYDWILTEYMGKTKYVFDIITPYISSRYDLISNNLIKYYKKISPPLPINDIQNFRISQIPSIESIDDMMFFDLCNNNFIFEGTKSFNSDSSMMPIVKKYIKFYNIRSAQSNDDYNYLFIDGINAENLDLIERVKTECIIVIKLDIFKKQYYNILNNFTEIYENKSAYSPKIGQLYTNYIYAIYSNRNSNVQDSYYFNIEEIIKNYLLNNKILVDYCSALYGYDHMKKIFIREFLQNI